MLEKTINPIHQAFILQTRSGQWKYEIWSDGQEVSGGAGYESEFDAMQDALENNLHLEGLNMVVQQGRTPSPKRRAPHSPPDELRIRGKDLNI